MNLKAAILSLALVSLVFAYIFWIEGTRVKQILGAHPGENIILQAIAARHLNDIPNDKQLINDTLSDSNTWRDPAGFIERFAPPNSRDLCIDITDKLRKIDEDMLHENEIVLGAKLNIEKVNDPNIFEGDSWPEPDSNSWFVVNYGRLLDQCLEKLAEGYGR